MSFAQQRDGNGCAGGNDEQRRAMIRGLPKPSLEQAIAATTDASHFIMGRMNVLNDISLPQHRFLMMPFAEQSRVHQLLNAENFARGLMEPHYQQLVTPHDDLALMAQQLAQQQQQLQLRQQQEFLVQAGELAEAAAAYEAAGIDRGIAAGNFGALGLLDLSSATHAASVPRLRGFETLQDENQGYYGTTSQQYNQSDSQGNSETDQQTTMKRRGESFPMVLLRILGDLEATGTSDVASFVAGGDAFLIRSPKVFQDTVLPRYFPRMGSFGSFQRQLNLYDFRRISEGPHRGAYTHPLFRRHMPMLSKEMKRTKIKGYRNNLKKTNGAEER